MNNQIFTVFMESNKFAGDILKIIFNIRKNNPISSTTKLQLLKAINKFNDNSKEFCDYFKDDTLSITDIDNFKKGYSAKNLGSLNYKRYNVYILDVSRYNNTFEPIYSKIVIKRTKNRGFTRPFLIEGSNKRFKNKSGKIIDLGDPYNEIFINTYLNIAYDSGNFIHIPKFYGSYWCGQDSYMINEHLDFTISDLLENKKHTDDYTLLNILFQVVYAMTYLKKCFGMRHFDLHLRNVMIKNVKNNKTIYQGKNLGKVNYLVYKCGNKIITLENTGMIVKIIDVAQAGVIVDSLEILDNGYSNFHSGEDAEFGTSESISEFFTMEIVFFLLNFLRKYIENISSNQTIVSDCILYLLKNLRDFENDEKITDNIINNLIKVENSNIGAINHKKRVVFKDVKTTTGYSIAYPDINANTKLIDGEKYTIYTWFMNRRNMGVRNVKNPETYFLNRFFKYLEKINLSDKNIYWITNNGKLPKVSKINDNTILHFEYDIKKGVDNELIKYYKNYSYYADICKDISDINYDSIFNNIITEDDGTYNNIIQKATNQQKCIEYKRKIVDRYDPNSTLKSSPFNNIITNKNNISKANGFYLLNRHILYKLIQLNPGILDMDYLKFKKRQRWIDYKYVSKDLMGSNIWNVRVHQFVKLKRMNIDLPIGKSLWETAIESKNDGLFINGGFFIVNKNIKNPLGLKVGFLKPPSKNDLYKHIGYYKSKDGSNTVLNVPFGYEKDYGVIIVDNNNFKLMKYEDFMNKHKLIKSKQLIQLGNNKIIEVLSDVIETVNNEPVIIDKKFKYDKAFVSGPVLIWNGKVVFDDKKLNELLKYNGKEYKIVEVAKNSNKYIAEEFEKDFPYGQRHSNTYVNHTIIAQDKKGNTNFFLIEGRGYYSPGLVRTQVAKLLKEFDIQYAISLDGGFSTQAVIKQDDKCKFVLNDPEKRNVGLSIALTI